MIVADRIDARLHRRLCELGGRLNQAGPDRVDEVGAVHTFQGLSHDVEIEQIPDDDLCAPPPEALGVRYSGPVKHASPIKAEEKDLIFSPASFGYPGTGASEEDGFSRLNGLLCEQRHEASPLNMA